MIIICPIHDRVKLLPYYLRYYSRIGISRFVFALHNGEANLKLDEIKAITAQFKVNSEIRTSVVCPDSEFNGPAETGGLNAIRQEFVKPDEWFCIADLDEFHLPIHPTGLRGLANLADKSGYDAVHGVFIDRISADGSFPDVAYPQSLDDLFPLAADLSKAATEWKLGQHANNNKIVLMKGKVEIKSGHHMTDAPCWLNAVEVHHFKWTAGVLDMLRQRFATFRAQRLLWCDESMRIVNRIKDGINLQDSQLNIRKARTLGI